MTPEQVERERARIRQRYELKRDEIRAKAKERYQKKCGELKAQGAAWRKANRSIATTLTANYRCRAKNIPGSHSAQEWRDLCAKFEHRCVCCGERKPLAQDHIIPVTKPNATNYISNIQPLCKSCNSAKHQMAIDYRRTPFIRQGIAICQS